MASKATTTDLLPAYAAVGDDALKRDAVARRLKARLEKSGDLSFDYDEFDGESASGADVVGACNTIPFASPVRMVRLKSVEKLAKADAEALVSYLADPSSSTVLLMEAEKLARNTRLFKAVASLGKGSVIDCATPKAADLPRLVRSMAVAHGIAITDPAARLLIDLVGQDTVRLDSELQKMAVAHRGSDPVNEHEVSSMVSRTTEVKPWEFLDAMCGRNLKRCMLLLSRMPSASPHSLMALCTGRVRELICAKALIERGEQHAIAAALKKKDWQVKHYPAWAGMFDRRELSDAIVSARDAERAMKSGTDPHQAFLDWLVTFVTR